MLSSTVENQKSKLAVLDIGAGFMTHLLIITENVETMNPLREKIVQSGLKSSLVSYDEAQDAMSSRPPDIVLTDISSLPDARKWDIIVSIKKQKNLPTIGFIPSENLAEVKKYPGLDDFITAPINFDELLLRIKRLLRQTGEADKNEEIQCEGLTIDLATCEVTVDGKKVDLTFKEYELLKLMASNRGRVFTREALLNKIWGYDYYGGDRTVDVHMRRLRSKIEDANHTYIETVRNIGYKFVQNS
jgi:two-component system alkaline phosphatase synthesis response regulator PhoP